MVRIGDIWHNGKVLAQPSYSRESFENLNIRPGALKLIKAGLSVDEHYLLPFSAHPWHLNHTNAYCIAIKVSNEITLIVPGAEMIRFYFGSCSILLHRLFTEPFSEERLFREKHYDAKRRHLHLKLADGIPRFAVPDIARIVTDDCARQAAASIYAHCLQASTHGEKAYPYTSFPFRGKTTLQAAGIWLPFAGQANRTFLAFQLLSCSHPFPFHSVSYDPCERALWKKSEQNNGQTDFDNTRVHGLHKEKELALDDADPGTKKSLRHIAFEDQIRFPDLRHKPIRPRELVVGEARQVFIRHEDETVEMVSFGAQSNAGRTRAVDACQDAPVEQKAPEGTKLPAFVKSAMAEAQAKAEYRKSMVCMPLIPFGESEPVFLLPMIVDEEGVIDLASLYSEPDGHQRMRRACFIGLYDGAMEIRKMVAIEGPKLGCRPVIKDVETAEIADLLTKIDCLEEK